MSVCDSTEQELNPSREHVAIRWLASIQPTCTIADLILADEEAWLETAKAEGPVKLLEVQTAFK